MMSRSLGLSFLGLVKIGVQNFVFEISEGVKALIAPLAKYSPIVSCTWLSWLDQWGVFGSGALCKMAWTPFLMHCRRTGSAPRSSQCCS